MTDLDEREPELAFELDRVATRESEKRDLDMVAAREGLQLGHRPRRQAHDEPAGRFAEQRGIHAQRRLGPDRGAAHADAPEQAALGKGHEHASLGAIVGRVQQPVLRSHQHQPVDRPLASEIESRRPSRDHAVLDLQILAATKIVVTRPDQEHEVAFRAQTGGKPLPVVVDQPDHAHDRRRIDGRLT